MVAPYHGVIRFYKGSSRTQCPVQGGAWKAAGAFVCVFVCFGGGDVIDGSA